MLVVNRQNSFPTLAEQRVAQTKWLKGTLTLHSDRDHVGGKSPEFVPTLAEQRVAQTKWLMGTLTLCFDRFSERSDVTRELCGLPCGCQGTAKFEFKSPSVHSVVYG
ncbi:hypothetical protein E2C01_055088 [Portunus trituberculatus]|uniref:Uncharacterized protein n=1 Tax=Portunus trituberculatus TaxID=210409 RepID=A0A5B7GTV4_PORTR|nr:hypothetical protein [Portunus trituberculatus]